MKRVVVTGAGSGFGLATARRLLARGHRVVATELHVDGLGVLRAAAGLDAALECVALDLRDPGAIVSICRDVASTGPVDGLVNNAGYAVFAAAADADMDAVAALFQANVLGTARVTQALLPALRTSRGVVVQISSVAGRMVFPESGFYAATKYAVEALSEALYLEHCAAGLRVAVVEPGAFDTGFAARATRASAPRETQGVHAEDFARWDAAKAAVLEAPQDPELVATAIVASIEGDVPFERIRIGADAHRILAARDALGDDAWVRLMGARVGGPDRGTGLPSVDELIALGAAAASARWPGLRPAWRAGLLDRWAETEDGARALALLAE